MGLFLEGASLSIVWVIEPPGGEIAKSIMCNFPVRVMASWDTMNTYLGIRSQVKPDIVIIDDYDQVSDYKLKELVDFDLPNAHLIRVRESEIDVQHDKIHVYKRGELQQIVGRIYSILRATDSSKQDKDLLQFKDLSFDFSNVQCRVMPDGEIHSLPLKEAQILRVLMKNPNRVLSREQLQSIVWPDIKVTKRTIDSHISRLRRRIGKSMAEIKSIYGGGYQLE